MSRCEPLSTPRSVSDGPRASPRLSPFSINPNNSEHLHSGPGVARSLARLLLNAALVGGLLLSAPGCLPPDFEVAPAQNQPIRIDKSLLTINPDRFIDVSNCQNLTFDVATAVSDPDGDPIQTVWLIDYEPNLGSPPDAVGFLRFTFRPCESPKLVPGQPLTLELFVLDRRPASFDDADLAKTIVDPETTTDNVVWFIGADDLSCCFGGGQ